MDDLTPEKHVEDTDETCLLPKRAEIAVSLSFDAILQPTERARIAELVFDYLRKAHEMGALIPAAAGLPKPKYVTVQPLPYRCDQCGKEISPFIMI